MNEFAAVFGLPDPARALRALGVPPIWHDETVAFSGELWADAPGTLVVGGESVWLDASGSLAVCGEIVPDSEAALSVVRRTFGLPPDAPPAAVFGALYQRHGIAAARQFPGMFAIAVYEKDRRQCVLLRDGVGARTLYAATDGRGGWWVAARLRTLYRSPVVSDAVSLPALRDYLTCAFVTGSRTLRRDVEEIRPGTALSLPSSRIETYWEPSDAEANEARTPEEHARSLRSLLNEAVRNRLPPSGPVGVYLSGGLDSSLVTALAARDVPGPTHTFAIHFGAPYPNELAFSEMVARHCGTTHHVLELPARLIRDSLVPTIGALDDPIGDPLTVPNMLLGRAAAQEGIGVILNGEGGDPCFGGPKNLPMLLHELYEGGRGTEEERFAAYFRSFQKCYDDLPRLLTPEVLSALKNEEAQEAMLAPFMDEAASPMRRYLNRLMHINVRLKGADQILTKVNNLTTANALVGQSPLFDPRIVEASFAIPPEMKLAGSEEKAILKQAVADLLPSAILTRPKSGMLVPVQAWMKRDLNRYARGLLLSRRSRIRPYIRQEVVREWLDYRSAAPFARLGAKLWLLLTLEIWLRENEKA